MNNEYCHNVFLAGPMRQDDFELVNQDLYQYCRAAAWLLSAQNLTVFAPNINNYWFYAGDLKPEQFPVCLTHETINLTMSQSFGRLLIPGHEISVRLQEQTIQAISLGKPIFDLVPVGKSYSMEHWTPRMEERFLRKVNGGRLDEVNNGRQTRIA